MFKYFFLIFCLASKMVLAQPGSKKVVFVIVDGIPADVLERVSTPNLDAIAKSGIFLRATVGGEKNGYSETPTISAVGYNSLLTGTWVNKHNVWGNDIKEPNYYYKNIFRLLKIQYPLKKVGVFSSWTDNRTKLVGDGLPEAGNIKVDYAFDGYELDTINFPHDKLGQYMHLIDEKVTSDAAQTIQNKAPDLSWVYLEYTDDVAHKFGDSKELDEAVTLMDKQVGNIWEAIQYRQKIFKEDWLIVITTDHGRDEQTGKGHGGQSLRQRTTWMVTNYNKLNNYTRYYTPAIVDIMPTMARFLNVKIPINDLREVDGIPMMGPVSIVHAQAYQVPSAIDVSWRALEKKGTVKIKVATTNYYKTGQADEYKLVAEVPLSQQHYQLPIKDSAASFYKFVLEAPNNIINVWVNKNPK